MSDLSARRPLKSRGSRWASALSRGLLRLGVKPNQVSAFSVVCAAGAAAFMLWGGLCGWEWLLAALCIQLRLLCNLMDGMLTVEGGLKSPHGDLFNEFPDRLADVFILAGLGYAGGDALSQLLGWLCACGALMTACVRMHGASLTGVHDFRGPMAKPHRMALSTLVCVLLFVVHLADVKASPVPWFLGLMLAGIVLTLGRRLVMLSKVLHERANSSIES